MTTKSLKISCDTKEEFIILQKYFFQKGYEWIVSGKNIFLPTRFKQNGGIILVVSEATKLRRKYLSYNRFGVYDITFANFMSDKHEDDRKVINFVNDVFNDILKE